jgi:hypothetical protein
MPTLVRTPAFAVAGSTAGARIAVVIAAAIPILLRIGTPAR